MRPRLAVFKAGQATVHFGLSPYSGAVFALSVSPVVLDVVSAPLKSPGAFVH